MPAMTGPDEGGTDVQSSSEAAIASRSDGVTRHGVGASVIDEAVAAADPEAWCRAHQRSIDADFVRGVKDRLDAALRSDPRLAVALGNLAIVAAAAVGDPVLTALATRGKAQALHQSHGATAEVIELYQRASDQYLGAGEEVEGARTLIGAIDALGDLGRTREALATAERISEIFTRHNELVHRAKVDLNVGNLYHRLERNREAGEYYWRARRVFARHGDKQLTALADTNLGNVATNLCNYRAAHTYYQRAARTLDSLGAVIPAAMNEVDIGWLHFIEGDYLRALATLNKAKRRFEQDQMPRHAAVCNLDLAEIYLLLENLDEAEQSARDARDVFEPLGHLVDAGRCLMILGAVEFRRGNRSRAESLLKEARDVLARSDSEALEFTARLQLADLYLRSGDPQGALGIADEASRQFERLELFARQGNAEIIMGRARAELGDAAGARRHFEKALGIGTSLGAQSILIEANIGLGRITRATEGAGAAIAWFDTAREYVVRVRGLLHPEALKTNFLDGRAAVYSDLVEAVLAADGSDAIPRALEIAEEAKSQALVDMLAGRVEATVRAGGTTDRALAERVRALQKELSALHGAIERQESEVGHRATVLASDLRSRLNEREQELSHRLGELEAANAEYVSLIRPERLPAAAIQSMVPEGAALIEYFTVGDRMTAFVVERDDIRVASIDMSPSAVRAAADDLAFDITRFAWSAESDPAVYGRLRESLDRRLSSLYDSLIAPLGRLPGQLIVVPHRALHVLPLHALRGPEGYLVDRHVVSYAPSASVLRYCLERAHAGVDRALVIGVTAGHLPFIAREANDVSELFGNGRLLTGEQASIEGLRRYAGDADIIHIASRGAFRDEKPIFSGIRMADGWLSARDAYDLRLRASLVTLSACQTGINGVSQSDEAVGLVRGFLYAGASAVLASLWTVDDRSTAEFMLAYYAAIRSGKGRAEALRQVQLEVKARLPEPYYWAPFVLIGAW
jgi:CHAT domain-containing protein/tetratricopeptide (TPR) repeat protein